MVSLKRTAGQAKGFWIGAICLSAACLLLAGCGGSAPNKEDRVNLSDIPRLKTACDAFKADCGRYPTKDEGLHVLFTQPGDEEIKAKWSGPYGGVTGPDDIKDPWGNTYEYMTGVKAGRSSRPWVRFWSNGPDGQPQSGDEVPPQNFGERR